MNYNLDGETIQVTIQDDRRAMLVEFCAESKTRGEMMAFLNLVNRDNFRRTYLKPLLESGQLKMTIQEKPNSKNRKYAKA